MKSLIQLLLFFFFFIIGVIEIIFSIVSIIVLKKPYLKIHINSKITTNCFLFIFICLFLYSKHYALKLLLIIFCSFFSSSLSSHILSRINFKK